MDATGVCYTQSGNVKRYENGQGPNIYTNNFQVDSIFSFSTTYTSDSCNYSLTPIGAYSEGYLLDVAGTYYVDVIYGNTTKRFNYKYNYNKVIRVNYYVAFGNLSHSVYAGSGQSVDTVKLFKTSGYNPGNYITIGSNDYIGNNATFRYEPSNNLTIVRLFESKYEFNKLGLSELNKYFQVYVNISTNFFISGKLNDLEITPISSYSTFSVSDFDIDPGSNIYINIVYIPKYVYLDTAWDIVENKSRKDWTDTNNLNYGSRIRSISTDVGGWNKCTNFLSQIYSSPYALVDGDQYKDHGTNFYAAPVIPRFNGFRTSLLVRKGDNNSNMTNTSDLATIGYDNLSEYTPRYEVVTSRGAAYPKNANITNGEFMFADNNDSYVRPFSSNDLDTYFFRATVKDGDNKYFDNDLGHYRNGVTNNTLFNGKIIALDYILHYNQTEWMGKHFNTDHYTGLSGIYSTNDNTDGTYNEIDKVLQGTMYWDGSSSDKTAPGILIPYFNATCQSMDYKQEIPQYGILTGIKGWGGSHHYHNWCATFSVPTYGGILAKPYDNSAQPYSITYGYGGENSTLPFRTTNNTGVKPGSMIVGRVHSGGAGGFTGVFWSRFYVDVISNIEFVKENWYFNLVYAG